MVVLPFVKKGVVVGGGEHGHENPFCNLGAVNTGGGRQRYFGVGVYWAVGDMICAGRGKMDEFEVGTVLWRRRQGRQGDKEGGILKDFPGNLESSFPGGISESELIEGDFDMRMVAADAVEYCIGRFERKDDKEMLGLLSASHALQYPRELNAEIDIAPIAVSYMSLPVRDRPS